MRIHGVQLQGLRNPPGEYRIDLDPGYNVVVAGAYADVLALALTAPLFPLSELDDLMSGLAILPDEPARISLGVSFGPDAYRLVVDLGRMQIALARYDPAHGRQARLAKGPAEVAEQLATLGLPERDLFRVLHACGAMGAPESAPVRSDEDTAPLLPALDPGDAEAAEDRERLKLLRDARDRRDRVDRDLTSAVQELEQRQGIAPWVEGFEVRLGRYREHVETRDREVSGLEGARRALLDERTQLRLVPRSQRGGTWIGLGLGVGGGIAGWLASPLLYGLGALGLGLGAFFALMSRSAQRRLGRVEARLSALRVRERSIAQAFDEGAGDLVRALEQLGLRSVEDLQREVADHRGLTSRIERLRSELEETRRAFSATAERELEQLESLCARRPAPVLDGPTAWAPSADPRLDPDELIRAAARGSDRSEVEVRQRMLPSLPLYLRALTEGRLTRARRGPTLTWELRREDGEGPISIDAVSPADRMAVSMAFRLALLEGLATSLRIPLLVGPSSWPSSPGQRAALGRALRRVASVVQVIRIAREPAEWDSHATALHALEPSKAP